MKRFSVTVLVLAGSALLLGALAAPSPAAAMKLCARVAKGSGEVREGAVVRLPQWRQEHRAPGCHTVPDQVGRPV